MVNSYRNSFYLLTSLFFMWGLITVLVDSLIPRLREIFELTYFQAGLVQFAFFIAYGIVSIPAGKLLQRIGYQRGIIVGLAVMGIGCLLFLPAASLRWYGLFLLAYFILASGMTLLQVAANPFVTVLGEPAMAASRLNLSQAFNSLGTTVAPALGAIFILSDSVLSSDELARLNESGKSAYFSVEASAVQGPFLILALTLFILAAVILKSQLPKLLKESPGSQYGQVLKDRKLVLGAIGIFVYVGAEVTIGSYLINYFLDMNLAELIRENRIMKAIVGQIQPITTCRLLHSNHERSQKTQYATHVSNGCPCYRPHIDAEFRWFPLLHCRFDGARSSFPERQPYRHYPYWSKNHLELPCNPKPCRLA